MLLNGFEFSLIAHVKKTKMLRNGTFRVSDIWFSAYQSRFLLREHCI